MNVDLPCTQSLRYRSRGHLGSERAHSHWVHSTTDEPRTRPHSWWPTGNRLTGYECTRWSVDSSCSERHTQSNGNQRKSEEIKGNHWT